ncbi:MAG: ABC transporter ATP-binding protein [Bacteroidota bacterium]
MNENVITIKNLNKTFGTLKAVERLNFEVQKADCFGLLGPNGAGKTTTMKIIYGKTEPDPNQATLIRVFGYDSPRESLAIKSLAGIVPQQDNLDTELNVLDNLLIYSKFYGMTTGKAKQRIEELLLFMELRDKAKAKIRDLSGGMKRRLTIARALLNNPRLLILDEPTTGLDPQVRHLIWNKLRELKENGVTILLTTHYMEEAFQICDRIIIMDEGKKIVEGKPKELLKQNLEQFVMEIHGSASAEDFETAYFDQNGIRYEVFNNTFYAYSNNSESLARFGETARVEEYFIRHSNLEDLFLKVTGRSLNELQ